MPTPEFTKWEKEIADFWKKNKVFEKSVENRPVDKPYVFYDGPPFATGLPHYGHLLASTIKDIVPRYQTMRGFRVRRRWGWDCHGLPIENIVEGKLGVNGKKEIEKMGIDKFNAACQKSVLTYTKQWGEMIDRLGRWVEFDNAYKTMDPTYMESIWWAVKQVREKGLLYEGRKVLMYCTRCETPVSKFEVAMDNSYQDVTEEAVYVNFVIAKSSNGLPEGTQLVAWTTTPWTLPGNVALAVGAGINYVLIKSGDNHYVVAQEQRELFDGDVEIVDTFKGADLVGTTYEPLYVIDAVGATGKKSHYVTAADFVTADEGSGIVHTAVAYGEDDYHLGMRIDLPIVPLLSSRGIFNDDAPELVRGEQFKAAERIIKKDLEERGLLLRREQNTHSYPFCWRCETPLIYNAIPAWFINIQKIKPRLLELNETMGWYPEHLKFGRFKYTIENAPDWNISRNRYFATPLPIWKCTAESCEELVVIGSLEELVEKSANYDEVYDSREIEKVDLHRPKIDAVIMQCTKCSSDMQRIEEVIDCWAEASSMPFAEHHYPFENKELFEARYPAQFVVEYIAQTRTWFFFMHVMSTILFDDISVENTVTTGTILNEKGEKLSKSKRNFPEPTDIIDRFGADALRWYLSGSVVMNAEDLFFSEREVEEVYRKVMMMSYNMVSFWEMYGKQLGGADVAGTEHVLDLWVLARLRDVTAQVTAAMDSYNTVRATRALREFIADCSTWYVRRSRDRFKTDGADAKAAAATLHHVLLKLTDLFAPFIPFTSEKMYQTLGGKLESVHLGDWPDPAIEAEDKHVLDTMKRVRKIVELGLAARAEAKIRVRQPLSSVSYTGEKMDEAHELIIAMELNVKSVAHGSGSDGKVVSKEYGDTVVAIDTTITDELAQEGAARELVRAINNLRKDKGFTVDERGALTVSTESEKLKSAVEVNIEYIEDGGRVTIDWGDPIDGHAVKIQGDSITISIIK